MFKTKYRIVSDTYLGFEIQWKQSVFSPWRMFPHALLEGRTNTFENVERAKYIFRKTAIGKNIKDTTFWTGE